MTKRPSRSVGAAARLAPVLVPLALLVITGLRGIDFGHHWDEDVHAAALRNTVDSGVLLPSIYYWPSVTYFLNLASLAPDIVTAFTEAPGPAQIRRDLHAAVDSPRYRLRTRVLYLVVCSMAVVWIYVLVLAWRESRWEAVAAAAILALSWEVAYHARWIAADALLMQFAALTLTAAILGALRAERRGWLWLAAAAAGLGCGTKWPAGLLLVPVALAGFLGQPASGRRPEGRLRLVGKLFLVFSAAYLVSTPGTLLDPIRFMRYLLYQSELYGAGFYGYTVSAGPAHLWKMAEYFALTFGSRYPLIAGCFFVLAVIGTYEIFKESRRLAWIVISFPALYLLYFSLHRVMIVRNLLALAPFFALLAARGAGGVAARLRHPYLRRGFAAGLGLLLAVNAGWLIYAGESIRESRLGVRMDLVARYIEDRPGTRFLVSPRVSKALPASSTGSWPNITLADSDTAEYAVFFVREAGHRYGWPANSPGLTTAWIGPYEINFDYYPTWAGRDRVVIMPRARALELGFPWPEAGDSRPPTPRPPLPQGGG